MSIDQQPNLTNLRKSATTGPKVRSKLGQTNYPFYEILTRMAQDFQAQTVFDPADPFSGYLFLRDYYSKQYPDVRTKIYDAVRTNLRDVAKAAQYPQKDLAELPTTNQLSRYDIENYIEKGYIDGQIKRGELNGKPNQVIESEVLLKHVIFLNLFLHKSGILGLPKKKPARKKGQDKVTVTTAEVIDFLNTFLGHMSQEEKKQFFGIE